MTLNPQSALVTAGYIHTLATSDKEARVRELERYIGAIKALVVGDKHPRWSDDLQTSMTRGGIADICDTALPTAPTEGGMMQYILDQVEFLRLHAEIKAAEEGTTLRVKELENTVREMRALAANPTSMKSPLDNFYQIRELADKALPNEPAKETP